MPNDWDDIIRKAAKSTNAHFAEQLSGLTRLTNADIEGLIMDSGISREDLADTLQLVKDAGKSNGEKAAAIRNIQKGVDVLVNLVGKLI
ncbi:MAG: hypothetical protein I8H66_08740 [Sphingobacteriia bacterium]|nr:hypothetical protein [Sphingobacteriia bacterium]